MMEIASTGQLRAALLRWVLVCVPGINLLGFLSAMLSASGDRNPWFAALAKPAIYPPAGAFPVVWSVLYVLMGVALAMVLAARSAPGRGAALGMFALHLVANLAWSPLFFLGHNFAWAMGDLGLMVISLLATMALFARVRPVAAWLLVPLLGWVLFAGVLLWQVWVLNPDGGADLPPVAARIQI